MCCVLSPCNCLWFCFIFPLLFSFSLQLGPCYYCDIPRLGVKFICCEYSNQMKLQIHANPVSAFKWIHVSRLWIKKCLPHLLFRNWRQETCYFVLCGQEQATGVGKILWVSIMKEQYWEEVPCQFLKVLLDLCTTSIIGLWIWTWFWSLVTTKVSLKSWL